MNRATLSAFLCYLVLSAGAFAQNAEQGSWTASREHDGKLQLQIRVDRDNHHSNHGSDYELSALGLKEEDVSAANHSVTFQLQREAGTLVFHGTFDRGHGGGTFDFTPNADYFRQLEQLGFTGVREQALTLATIDVTLAYATEFKELGLGLECEHLIQGRIFNVNRQQVEELRALGYTNVPLQKLVELRIFKVDGAYIRAMRAQGTELSLDKLVESRIFEITPEDRKAYADLGYTHLTQDELTAFKIHGVTPQYIREMRELGFKDLSPQKLQEFRIFGVGRDQIEDLKSVGYSDVTAQNLIDFKIHGVNSAFIRKVQKYGYTHPTPSKLVEMKITGIRVRDGDTL